LVTLSPCHLVLPPARPGGYLTQRVSPSLSDAAAGGVMAKTLDDLVRYLDGLRGRAPLAELTEVLTDAEVAMDDLAAFLPFAQHTARRTLARAGDWYNPWVLSCRNGQRSPIHDHKGSSCGVRVLEGTATETLFTFAPNGHVKALFSRDVLPGGVVGSEDADV